MAPAAASLRNPRLLGIALELLQNALIRDLSELGVSRLLFEHMRVNERDAPSPQPYPFEEQAITVHEANHELLISGIYNPWVQKSLDRLAVMMPGRYAKSETSEGFLGSIDVYAYRMPIAPPPLADGVIDGETAPDATAVIAGDTDGSGN